MTAIWSEVRFSGGMSLLASAPSCTHRGKWIRLHSKGPPALILGGKEAQGMHSQESEVPTPTVEEGAERSTFGFMHCLMSQISCSLFPEAFGVRFLFHKD